MLNDKIIKEFLREDAKKYPIQSIRSNNRFNKFDDNYLSSTNRRLSESPNFLSNESIPSLDRIDTSFSWDNYVSGMC